MCGSPTQEASSPCPLTDAHSYGQVGCSPPCQWCLFTACSGIMSFGLYQGHVNKDLKDSRFWFMLPGRLSSFLRAHTFEFQVDKKHFKDVQKHSFLFHTLLCRWSLWQYSLKDSSGLLKYIFMYFNFVGIRKNVNGHHFLKNAFRVLRLRRKRFSFKYKIHFMIFFCFFLLLSHSHATLLI